MSLKPRVVTLALSLDVYGVLHFPRKPRDPEIPHGDANNPRQLMHGPILPPNAAARNLNRRAGPPPEAP